jgi:hypothetical protein
MVMKQWILILGMKHDRLGNPPNPSFQWGIVQQNLVSITGEV